MPLRPVDAALTWLSQQWSRLRWLLLALALVAVVAATLWPLPALLTRHPSHGLSAAERLKATNDVRTTLVQALGGLALFGGLLFTARTFGLTREGQRTDRYTKAVEQLGNEKLDVRLGGIYALERLMVDSERDHPTIVEVLAAFLREHATTPTGATSTSWLLRVRSVFKERPVWPSPMPADTAAAARVIARRPGGRVERGLLDLHRCYLSGADLYYASLYYANLSSANLSDANLSSANLSDANLSRARLSGADLSRARLSGANLSGANLVGADLSDARLFHADLSYADLSGADLSRAILFRVHLASAKHLTGKQLDAAASTEGATLPNYSAKDLS